VMRAGELLQLGTPGEIYENPADLFVAGFMGSPSMNLMPAKLVLENGRVCASLARAEGMNASLPLAGNGAWEAHLGRDVILGLRPEHISDRLGPEVPADGHHRLECVVEVTEPTGPDMLAVMRLGGVEATARLQANAGVRPGDTTTFVVDMTKACLFDPTTERRIAA
jgi:multiple sugar transport system ATP-binding protein